MTLQWEKVSEEAGGGLLTERARIQGTRYEASGWLYRCLWLPGGIPDTNVAMTMVFVPNPEDAS